MIKRIGMSFNLMRAVILVSLFADAPRRNLTAQPGHYTTQPSKIVRLDPAFDRIVPKDAVLEKVADGFAWVEGPLWNRAEGYLLFSDIPNNAVMKWTAQTGASVFLKPSGYTGAASFTGIEPSSNSLTYDRESRLVLCEHGDRRVSRLEKNGTKTTLADRYQGKRLNSPNDAVFKSNGDMYFTDPPFSDAVYYLEHGDLSHPVEYERCGVLKSGVMD